MLERTYERGGQFAAWECLDCPEEVVRDLREMCGRGGGAEGVVEDCVGLMDEPDEFAAPRRNIVCGGSLTGFKSGRGPESSVWDFHYFYKQTNAPHSLLNARTSGYTANAL